MSAQDQWKRRGIVDDLNAAIRENPLAAGLIGAGALWMLLGRRGVGIAAAGAGLAADKLGSAAVRSARSAAHAAGSAGSSVASSIKDVGSRGVDAIASIVPDMSGGEASDYGFTADQMRSRTRTFFAPSTGRYLSDAKSKLADTFDRQPLLLGAVGLAIGAAIASSFATTAVESEWIGEQGAAAREKLKDAAKDATERAWQAGKQEAERQNLTEEGVLNTAERLTEKAQNVLKAGRETLQEAASDFK